MAQQADCEQSSSANGHADTSSSLDVVTDRIGVIGGAGAMATAMISGWVDTGISAPERICTSDRFMPGDDSPLARLGCRAFAEAAAGGAEQVALSSDIILLAVKPQAMEGVLRALAPHVQPHHLVVSIAAGVRLEAYEAALPRGTRIARVMPNTPLLVRAGASAYCMGRHATPEDEARLRALLAASGLVVECPEDLMDAVTALSGSGPAFIYMVIEALSDGGVQAGLSRETSLMLAAQTALGSAAMVLQAAGDGTITHPGVLKDKVASPAGTTIAGIGVLEAAGVRSAFMNAVAAAAARSRELSQTNKR